eukprot:385009-Rhodomonas_salina.5
MRSQASGTRVFRLSAVSLTVLYCADRRSLVTKSMFCNCPQHRRACQRTLPLRVAGIRAHDAHAS